jgi:hypothetical protein
MQPSSTNGLFTQMLDMLIGPSYDNGVTFTVNPTDLTLEADYNFYLGVMAEGNPI